MLKKENFIPIILLLVGIAFIAISILVFFSKGNTKLVKHKLKLGAIIIGLTASAVSCRPVVTCYEPAMPPDNDQFSFDIDSFYQGTIILKLPEDSLLTGKIYDCTKLQYSYLLQDLSYIEKYRDNIISEDGNFNTNVERFIIKIPVTIDTGTYYLRIYTNDKSQIDSVSPKIVKRIKITK